MSIEKLFCIDWNVRGKDTKYLTHDFHPYFAKFPPQVPNQLITHFTEENEVILDPFCGSGTALVEACLLGRNNIGVDRSPLACLITKVKTTCLSRDTLIKIHRFLLKIEMEINTLYGQKQLLTNSLRRINYELPSFFNRDYWFKKHVMIELTIIRAHINEIDQKDLRDFMRVAFSSIITIVSNQQSESRYSRIDKKIQPKEAFTLFKKKVLAMEKKLVQYIKKRKDTCTKIFNEDTRTMYSIEDRAIDFVITSPPYLNAWDYNLYQRFRFFWLDFDLEGFKKNEIGAHLQHYSKKDGVERYRIDMSLCLKQISRVLKPDKYACIVNSSATIHKKFVDTNEILIKEGEKYHLTLVNSIERIVLGPHYGLVASLGTRNLRVEKKREKKESILIFKNF